MALFSKKTLKKYFITFEIPKPLVWGFYIDDENKKRR